MYGKFISSKLSICMEYHEYSVTNFIILSIGFFTEADKLKVGDGLVYFVLGETNLLTCDMPQERCGIL